MGMVPHASLPKPRSLKAYFSIFARGILMGVADVVPGVSGGTIAFVTGIYEDLLNSIKSITPKALRSLVTLQLSTFSQLVAWEFLITLVMGMSCAIVSLASVLSFFLGHESYHSYLYAIFMGLIAASIFFCLRQVKKWSGKAALSLVLGMLLAFLFTGTSQKRWVVEKYYDVEIALSQSYSQADNYSDVEQRLYSISGSTLGAMIAKGILDEGAVVYSHAEKREGVARDFVIAKGKGIIDPWIFFCGVVGIMAMLLPGVSGGYVLTILGTYGIVIGAIADFTGALRHGYFHEGAFMLLSSLFLGILCGALVFSRIISWLFRRYRNIALSLLVGFMVGALPCVWPFRMYEFNILPLKIDVGPQLQLLNPVLPDVMASETWWILCVSVLSFAFVFALEKVSEKRRIMQKTGKSI